MSLMIRLASAGRRGERKYDVVVMEKRERREGRPLEVLGFFEKKTGGITNIKVDQDRVNHWRKVGAQLSVGAKKILEAKV